MYTSHIKLDICSIELISDVNNPWMVLIHGFGGSRHMWKRQVEEFKHDYNLMILELPRHRYCRNCQAADYTYSQQRH